MGAGRADDAAFDRAQAATWREALRADWRRPRTPWQGLRLAGWIYIAVALMVPVVRLAGSFDSVALPFVVVPAIGMLLWLAPRQGEFHAWAFYIVSIYFFTQLRDAADETAIAASTGYVRDWEEWMFGGTTPSAWLQAELGGGSGNPGALAYLSTLLHWTWFFFPHVMVAGTFFWKREMFFRVTAIMVAIFYTGVALYYLVPTVPPWLAAQEGNATGITRIISDVGGTLFGQSLSDRFFELLAEPNARAAMPSLHFAASFQVVLIGWMLRLPWMSVVAGVYSAALGFALIYLGEHYFVDILVGGLAAAVSFFIVERAVGGPGLGLRLGWLRGRRRGLRTPATAVGFQPRRRRELTTNRRQAR